jgi:acyl-CoA dehydrogenase
VRSALAALAHAERWLKEANHDRAEIEPGARRFAMTLSRALALALLAEHAQWSLHQERDGRPRAAALRFARSGIDLIVDEVDIAEAYALANDTVGLI